MISVKGESVSASISYIKHSMRFLQPSGTTMIDGWIYAENVCQWKYIAD